MVLVPREDKKKSLFHIRRIKPGNASIHNQHFGQHHWMNSCYRTYNSQLYNMAVSRCQHRWHLWDMLYNFLHHQPLSYRRHYNIHCDTDIRIYWYLRYNAFHFHWLNFSMMCCLRRPNHHISKWIFPCILAT